MHTPYDVRARVVECANCGAPLTLLDSAAAKCAFCGTDNQMSTRPNDGRGPLSPAQEIARLAQLKAQVAHTIPGHVYDLSGLPPSLMFAGATAAARSDLTALHRLWNHAKAIASEGLEQQRALCWVAIQAARLLSAAGQHEGARAKLETALNYLTDSGHRLLVRTELCLEATQRGELAAARGWLAECDPAPEVLELDSALRYASARICLAENNPARALSLIGNEPDALPVQKLMAPHFMLVRIHAFELGRRFEEANALWAKFVVKTDEAAFIAIAQREGLAPQTRLGPIQRRARDLASQIADAQSLSFPLASALAWAPIVTLALALLVSIEGCVTKRGPLMGVTGVPACALLCESCAPPLTYHVWNSNDSMHLAVFCDDSRKRPSQMDFAQLMAFESEFPHLDLPGGVATLYALSYVILFPLGVVGAVPIALSRRRRLRGSLPDNRRSLGSLEQELARSGREARPRGQRWLRLLCVSLVFLVSMSAFAGAMLTACSSDAPRAAQR